jgi:glutamine synthetase
MTTPNHVNEQPGTASASASPERLPGQDGRDPVRMVLLAVPTMTGHLRGKACDATYFHAEIARRGSHAAAYLLTTDTQMRMLPGFALGGWEHGAGDIQLRPDLASLRPAGWLESTMLVFADACDAQGRPIPQAPRTVLADQVGRLAELGLSAALGIESEAAVYDISYGDAQRRGYRNLPPVAGYNTDYALAHPQRLIELINLIRCHAHASLLRLEAVKTEAGPGQLEVTFRHSEPIRAADHHMVYKLLAHAAAESLGLSLTFMAKPFTGSDGNSSHLHLSLQDQDGASVLVDDEGKLTETGRHAVAGCLAALDQLAVLMLPTVNSYKRLHPDGPPLFAPSNVTWGYDNRTCALRVLGAGESGRIECRIPGADAQPHLAAAALIAAVAHGIREKLPLTAPPVSGSAYDDSQAALLPRSLPAALEAFGSSALTAELLGNDVVAHYAQAGWHEADYHRTRVSDLERERGFAHA